MKKNSLLYINDYANDYSYIGKCNRGEYPTHHLWGIDHLHDNFDVYFAKIKGYKNYPRISLLLNNLLIFILYAWRIEVIYSALPGYSLLFLLCKKLHIKKYRIVTVVHHPTSKVLFPRVYDKLLFISPFVYNKYKHLPNAEYLFWGGDMTFYTAYYNKNNEIPKYDFISAGKTYRDYVLFEGCMKKLSCSYITFGSKNSSKNEISYVDLMQYYNKSRFVVIPVIDYGLTTPPVLCGLTSFIDAIMLGIPLLMADNTLIGIDIEEKGLGLLYHAGNEMDFMKKARKMLAMTDCEYQKMRDNCFRFSEQNNYNVFCAKLLQILKTT